jgi:hypothetical protein
MLRGGDQDKTHNAQTRTTPKLVRHTDTHKIQKTHIQTHSACSVTTAIDAVTFLHLYIPLNYTSRLMFLATTCSFVFNRAIVCIVSQMSAHCNQNFFVLFLFGTVRDCISNMIHLNQFSGLLRLYHRQRKIDETKNSQKPNRINHPSSIW